MAASAQRPALILPVLLAVIGVISLAIAVMLVPVIIRESLAQAAVTAPHQLQRAAGPVAAPPDLATPPVAAPVVAPAPDEGAPVASSPEPTADTERAAAPDEATAPERWTIRINKDSYKPIAHGKTAFEGLAAYLKSHPQTSASLTGINNPMRSRKKAKYAARRIKELLIEAGVERYRMRTAGAQEAGAEGLVVRAEIVGGER
jgi:hypothetical protein